MAEQGGLLDLSWLNSPGGMGLLSAVGAGLAGARRGGTWNAVGSGLLGGVQGYAQGQELQQQSALNKTRQKLFDSQVAENDLQAQARKQALEMQQRQRDYLGSIGKVTSPRLDAQPNKFDPMQALSLGMSPEMVKTVAEAPNLGRPTIKDYKEIRNPDGSVSIVGFNEFGDATNTKQTPFKAPEIRSFGGYIGGIDPITGKVSKLGDVTMSQAEIASNAVARGNLAVSQARLSMDQRKSDAETASGGYSTKPLPAAAMKMQNDALDVIAASSNIDKLLSDKQRQIESGSLSFGPVSNLVNKGRNLAGQSNEQSRNFASFVSDLERMRNESLRLNAGVQTDGDAQRAWNELFQNINDTNLVGQRLNEIRAINKRAVELQRLKIDNVRSNYQAAPFDYSRLPGSGDAGGSAASPQPQGKTVVRTGTMNGRKVVQYSDGTTAYAD